MKKFSISMILAVVMIFSVFSVSASALDCTVGYAGVNNYKPYCSKGDRAGVNYCRNLDAQIQRIYISFGGTRTTKFKYENNSVTKTNLLSTNNKPATWFIWSGHGFNEWSDKNSFHLPYYNGYTHKSLVNGGELNPNINFSTLDASFKHKYVVAYTCNWLANGGSTTKQENIFKTMKGTRIMMGFASVMFLDSREANLFGLYMESDTITDAFINAAKVYQPQNSDTVIARVMGYNGAKTDHIYNANANAPYYTSSPSSFSTFTTIRIQPK